MDECQWPADADEEDPIEEIEALFCDPAEDG